MERLQRITDKLINIGENYGSLKPFILEYLNKIETLAEEREQNQSEALKILKDRAFTPAYIAQKLGCSRTTLYNHNQILKRYVEYSAERLIQQNPLTEIDEATHRRQLLETKVSLMEIRDIDNERLKYDCKLLTNQLKAKSAEIQRLQNRVMELTSELQKHRFPERSLR